MRIVHEPRFLRDLENISPDLQRRTQKQVKLLLENPRHPSLRARKMEGHLDVYEARITREYRFTYTVVGDTIHLRRIGTHEILKAP